MAKKKAEVVESIEETTAVEEITKEQICEFYGISDEEVIDGDYSKYGVKPEEAKVLDEWAKVNVEVKAGDIEFSIYKGSEEVRAILEKYGITPEQVASGDMGELSEAEKDIITDYYNELVKGL